MIDSGDYRDFPVDSAVRHAAHYRGGHGQLEVHILANSLGRHQRANRGYPAHAIDGLHAPAIVCGKEACLGCYLIMAGYEFITTSVHGARRLVVSISGLIAYV